MTATLFFFTACDPSDPGDFEGDDLCEGMPAAASAEALDLYRMAWGEETPSQRSCLLHRSLAPGARLTVGDTNIEGREAVAQALEERISAVSEAAQTRTNAPILTRHAEALVSWSILDVGGESLDQGEDWLEFDEEGRLARIHVFAGQGDPAPLTPELLQWETAWNTRDQPVRTAALLSSTTEDVHFTDLLTDVRDRAALEAEIACQQDTYAAELTLDDNIHVFATLDGEPSLVRLSAWIDVPDVASIYVVDYVRLRDGRIERLAGFPTEAP